MSTGSVNEAVLRAWVATKLSLEYDFRVEGWSNAVHASLPPLIRHRRSAGEGQKSQQQAYAVASLLTLIVPA